MSKTNLICRNTITEYRIIDGKRTNDEIHNFIKDKSYEISAHEKDGYNTWYAISEDGKIFHMNIIKLQTIFYTLEETRDLLLEKILNK